MRAHTLLVAAAAAALLAGCASTRDITDMTPGEEQVVERVPDDVPDWLTTPYEEDDERLLFKGEATNGGDAALCMRQAKGNGVQSLVEAIKIKARSEFSEAVRGVNVSESSLGRYLDNVVAWTTENVQISGVVPENEYRDKVQVRTYDGVQYRYNCFVQLSVPVESYLRARQAALTRGLTEAEDVEARRLAERAKEKLSQ